MPFVANCHPGARTPAAPRLAMFATSPAGSGLTEEPFQERLAPRGLRFMRPARFVYTGERGLRASVRNTGFVPLEVKVSKRAAWGAGLPVAVDAAGAAAGTIMSVVDHAVDCGSQMFGDADDEAA